MAESSGGSLRELVVSLFIKTDKASAKEAENHIEAIKTQLESAASLAKDLLAAFFIKKSFSFLQDLASDAGQLGREAARLGETTEDLERLRYAAKMTGATTEDLSTGLNFLARSMDAAKQGSGDQAQAFKRLGISLFDTDGKAKNIHDVFYEVADAMKATEDPGKRARITTELFGRGARDLIPTLMKGGDALRDFGDEAERFGIIQAPEFFQAAREFSRELKRIKAIAEGLAEHFGQQLFASFTGVFRRITAWYSGHSAEIIAIVEKAGRIVAEIFTDISQILEAFITVISPIIDAFKVFFEDIKAGTPAFDIFIASVAILAAIFAPWTALIIGVGLVLDDFFTYLRGGPSIIGHFVDKAKEYWDLFQTLFDMTTVVDSISGGLDAAFEFLKEWFGKAIAFVGSSIDELFGGFAKIGKFLSGDFGLGDIKAAFGGGSDAQAAASNSTSNANSVNSNFNAAVTINAAAGSSGQDIAGAVTSAMDEWHDNKMREAYNGLVGSAQ